MKKFILSLCFASVAFSAIVHGQAAFVRHYDPSVYENRSPVPFGGAVWISTGYTEDEGPRPCPVFVRKFVIGKPVASATLTITALGLYEARINDVRIGDAYLTPGFTSYDKRLQYQQYELRSISMNKFGGVAKHAGGKMVLPDKAWRDRQVERAMPLHEGENRIAITVADGWYRGIFGGKMERDNYGTKAGLLCRLDVTYQDGSVDSLVSDERWGCGTGMRRFADFYQGEDQDTRLPLVADADVQPVRLLDPPLARLVPNEAPPVVAQYEGGWQSMRYSPKGELVMDFGQNRAGWVELTIQGKEGDTVSIHYAEMLDSAGNFYTANLREAKAVDRYVLSGKRQILRPAFTYHGFRYVKLEGVKRPDSVSCLAYSLHSDVTVRGAFNCSNELVNKLVQNIQGSLESNFVDIPTDCPQRSERLGWTGDAQVFCRTAAYLTDCKRFFQKYCRDLAADQGVNGGVPNIIPDVYHHLDSLKGGVAGWGDAATIIPWTLYEFYGDTALLREQYPSMRAWVDFVNSQSPGHLWLANGYGDWYAQGEATSLPYIDACFFAHSLSILVRTARILGNDADAERYQRMYEDVVDVFLKTFILPAVAPEGCQTQTAYVLALAFDLLPDSMRLPTAKRLVQKIADNHGLLATGFLGTPYLLPVLSRYGYPAIAYRLLLEKACPSWLYPVTRGATTIWERWDAIRPDGSMQETSYNHYAYGAVGQWLFETVGGIQAAVPGYDTIRIAPVPGPGLDWAGASYVCKYGMISSEWGRKKGRIVYKITIPAGAAAIVALPGRKEERVGAGKYRYDLKAD